MAVIRPANNIRLPAIAVSGSTQLPAPQWWLDQPDDTWVELGTNTAEDIGADDAVTDAFNGALVDQDRRELISFAQGGHNNSSDNSIFGFTLWADEPAWYRITEASTATGGSEANGDYGDGKMRSVHGWSRAVYANDKYWYPGMDGMWFTGAWHTLCWSFDRGSLGDGPFPIAAIDTPWTNHGEGMSTSGGTMSFEGGCAEFDSQTGLIWSVAGAKANGAGQSVFTTNVFTDALAAIDLSLVDVTGADQPQPRWSAMATDLRVWILGCPYEEGILLLDMEDPTEFVFKTTTGTPSANDADEDDGCGAVYHAATRSIYAWYNDGANLRKLTIPADPLNGDYVWSLKEPAVGNTVTPVNAHESGCYKKFNTVHDMGDGRAAFVLWPRHDSKVYVFKPPAVP